MVPVHGLKLQGAPFGCFESPQVKVGRAVVVIGYGVSKLVEPYELVSEPLHLWPVLAIDVDDGQPEVRTDKLGLASNRLRIIFDCQVGLQLYPGAPHPTKTRRRRIVDTLPRLCSTP